MTEESVFAHALAIGNPAERAAYLDRACAGNAVLRAEVEALLDAHAASNALDRRPADVARTGAYAPERATDPDEALGAVLAGKYKLVELIGAGGMGAVYMAQQTEPVKRLVAVKVIRDGMDTRQVLARFEAERQALALMDHPNIAKVLDAGTTDRNRPFFVMELVKGVPITEFCDARKLSPRERLELFVPVCQAIQHAHQKGVIHRDIKPTNVLVALYDGKPVPKVIDFGVAKAAGQPLTDTTLVTGFGAIVGTPEYMSPEQAELNQLDIDTRSDVFALGVLLYELLTGTTPLNRSQLGKAALLEVLRIVREVEPPKPSTRVSTSGTLANIAANRNTDPVKLSKLMRGELDWIVMKALEKDRNRRYESATALAKDVERHLRGDAVEACPPTLGYRLRKAYRRNRAAVLTAGAFVGVLLAGTAVATVGLVRAERARQAEAEQRGVAEAKTAEAEGERTAAVAARTQAMTALRSATDDVVGKLIGAKEKLGTAETEYLETALRRWQEFAAAEGDGEQARAIRAEGHGEVAKLRYRLGRREESIADWRTALSLYEKLAADFPRNGTYRHKLADLHRHLGFLLGASAEREQHLARGYEMLRELTAEFPDVPEYWESLAQSLGTANDRVREQTDPNCAVRDQLAIYRRLADARPTEPRHLMSLGYTLGLMANWLEQERNEPGALEHRRAAVAVYERLRKLDPKSRQYRRVLASAHVSLWEALRRSADPRDAEEHYRKALALREELASDHFGDADDLSSLELLRAMRAGRTARATSEQFWRARLAEAEKNVADYPGLPINRVMRIQALADLGNWLLREERYGEAREQHEQAMTHLRASRDIFTRPDHWLLRVAEIELGLGEAYTGLRNRPEAEAHMREAVALSERIARDNAVKYNRTKLGQTYTAHGRMLGTFGDHVGAMPWYDKAIATLEGVLNDGPQQVWVKNDLCGVLWSRTWSNHKLKQYDQGVRDMDRAIELSSPGQKARYRGNRANMLACAGRVKEALDEVTEMLKSLEPYPPWYSFACVYSVASAKVPAKTREYADQAMNYLRKAIAVGWQDHAVMADDTDMDPIRERDDYKALVAGLERMAPPPREVKR